MERIISYDRELGVRISLDRIFTLIAAILLSAGIYLLLTSATDLIYFNPFQNEFLRSIEKTLTQNRLVVLLFTYYLLQIFLFTSPNQRVTLESFTTAPNIKKSAYLVGLVESILFLLLGVYLISNYANDYIVHTMFVGVLLSLILLLKSLRLYNMKVVATTDSLIKRDNLIENVAAGFFGFLTLSTELLLIILMTLVGMNVYIGLLATAMLLLWHLIATARPHTFLNHSLFREYARMINIVVICVLVAIHLNNLAITLGVPNFGDIATDFAQVRNGVLIVLILMVLIKVWNRLHSYISDLRG